MAHILEFTVEGLAGRKNSYSQKLNRDVNVFFGLNGSGKTSLLKILHSAMSTDTAILRRTAFTSAEVKIYSVDYDAVFTRTIEKVEMDRVSSVADADVAHKLPSQEVLLRKLLAEGGATAQKWTTKPKPKKGAVDYNFNHRYLPTSRFMAHP